MPERADRDRLSLPLLRIRRPGRRLPGLRVDVGIERAGLVIGERAGALQDPDVVVLVHRDAADLADQPIVGQRLGPARIDLEARVVLAGRLAAGKVVAVVKRIGQRLVVAGILGDRQTREGQAATHDREQTRVACFRHFCRP